jgi:hypothetical protein
MKIILLLFLTANIYNAYTQALFQPYNLDYEIGSGINVPIGWRTDKESTKSGYEFSLNDKDAIRGIQSAAIYNYSAEKESSGSGFQTIDATPFKGKTIKLSGYFKIDSKDPASYGEFFAFSKNKKDVMLDYAGLNANSIREKTWSLKTIQLKVATNADRINFGYTLSGAGALFADNIQNLFYQH